MQDLTPPLLIFDMDGVLVDSYEAWFRCLNAVLAAEGKATLSPGEFAGCWGQGVHVDVQRWFPHLTAEALGRKYDREFPRWSSLVRPMPGAPETLARLRAAGRRVACATNTPRAVAEQSLGRTGLRGLLDDLVGADEAGADKPDPAMLRLLAARAKAGPADTLMVGDTDKDRLAARAFGCAFVGFRMRDPEPGHPHCTDMEALAALLLEGKK